MVAYLEALPIWTLLSAFPAAPLRPVDTREKLFKTPYPLVSSLPTENLRFPRWVRLLPDRKGPIQLLPQMSTRPLRPTLQQVRAQSKPPSPHPILTLPRPAPKGGRTLLKPLKAAPMLSFVLKPLERSVQTDTRSPGWQTTLHAGSALLAPTCLTQPSAPLSPYPQFSDLVLRPRTLRTTLYPPQATQLIREQSPISAPPP